MDNFEIELEQGLRNLRQKKQEQLKKYEEQLKEMRNKIGEVLAEKELYMYRTTIKGHQGWQNTIQELHVKSEKLIHNYNRKSNELNFVITTLKFDIESLDEIIKE